MARASRNRSRVSCSSRSSPPTAREPGSACTWRESCARPIARRSTMWTTGRVPISGSRRKRRAPHGAPSTPPMKSADRRASPSVAQVLVVDDEPDIRELLELTLVKMGLGVRSVGTIKEAKALLKDQRFSLCLTDMRLSDGEGLEVVRHIASLAVDLPVAVIT